MLFRSACLQMGQNCSFLACLLMGQNCSFLACLLMGQNCSFLACLAVKDLINVHDCMFLASHVEKVTHK